MESPTYPSEWETSISLYGCITKAQERMTGLEPATSYLEGTHSTNWATSAFLFWWTRMESNHWPSHYECAALTVWATSPKRCRWKVLINFTGSFSVTPPLRIRYVSMLLVSIHCLFRHTGIFLFLWRITDSNRWPLRCKRSALSAELIPQCWTYRRWESNPHELFLLKRF